MTEWLLPPDEIERRSMAVIEAEAGDHDWDHPSWTIIRRMIHATADFDWMTSVRIHPQAIDRGLEAIGRGAIVFTDTRMAQAGISAARLKGFGGEVRCLINDEEVVERARSENLTRSAAAVDLALPELEGAIYVVGNAPTALFRLIEHFQAGRARPALIVGLPVGFINAAESKAALLGTDAVYITNAGRRGGSPVAAAVINALAGLAADQAP
jgi:precorrin-8X/cobalt-precorrin-8 methylmutase